MALRNAIGTLIGALALGAVLAITGCNSDSDFPGWEATGNQAEPDAIVTTSVVGSVGDGPIVGARLQVFSNDGRLLMETHSSNTADYELTIRTQGRNYPLTIVADQGTDIVTNAPPDFSLTSVIMKPGNGQIANLNPYSTLIAESARRADGGINAANIAAATDAVVRRYGFGLDPSLVIDPMITPMDDSNVHVIVKASEAMGEMIRRTRDVLITSGTFVTGDAVVEALAADLIDGWIDGDGAEGHDPRIAAVANVASGAVLIEAMANRLHVYNVDATDAMDLAIQHVRPNATGRTRDVRISAEALSQSKRSLRAAGRVAKDDRVSQTLAVIEETEPGTTEIDALPSGIWEVLNAAILATAYVSDEYLLDEMNALSSDEGNPVSPPDFGEDNGSSDHQEEIHDTVVTDDPVIDDGLKTGGETGINDDHTLEEEPVTAAPAPGGETESSKGEEPVYEPTPVENDSQPSILWNNNEWHLLDGQDAGMQTELSLSDLAETSFTIEAIVQFSGDPTRNWSPIFGSSAPTFSNEQILNIGKVRGTDELRVNIGGLGPYSVGNTGIFDGNQRHVAVVFDRDAGTMNVFVDQRPVDLRSDVSGTVTASSDLLLGATGHAGNERWLGWIGPTRVTATALEPAQFLVGDANIGDEPLKLRPNTPPTISGTPDTQLVAGNPWSFTPTAADADGDTLSFEIDGKPDWASFDRNTGKLSGTPPWEARSYGPITITVRDHMDHTSLEAFTLQVVEPTLGSAMVSWTPPTERTDGTTLEDLAGYRVYYGKDADSLTKVVNITNVGQTSTLIENLGNGTWYFAVTAYCSSGLESAKSNVGSKSIM